MWLLGWLFQGLVSGSYHWWGSRLFEKVVNRVDEKATEMAQSKAVMMVEETDKLKAIV